MLLCLNLGPAGEAEGTVESGAEETRRGAATRPQAEPVWLTCVRVRPRARTRERAPRGTEWARRGHASHWVRTGFQREAANGVPGHTKARSPGVASLPRASSLDEPALESRREREQGFLVLSSFWARENQVEQLTERVPVEEINQELAPWPHPYHVPSPRIEPANTP